MALMFVGFVRIGVLRSFYVEPLIVLMELERDVIELLRGNAKIFSA